MGKIELLRSLQEQVGGAMRLAGEAHERWSEAVGHNKALGKENEALKRENEALKAKIREYREFIFQLGKADITKV